MKYKKYLSQPCPHCGCKTLQSPQPTGARLYSRCGTCNLKSLYVINDKVDGSKAYSIIRVGAKNNDMVRATFWITRRQKTALEKRSPLPGMQSQLVRRALDAELEP